MVAPSRALRSRWILRQPGARLLASHHKRKHLMDATDLPDDVPDDPRKAFAWFVSHCSSGLYKELMEQGKTDTQARNTVIYCFLDFAAGEACRIAMREEREPNIEKWQKATTDAFDRAVKRTAAKAASHLK